MKKVKGYVIKLDIEKAFDKIQWGFNDYILLKKNYSNQWSSWMQSCFNSVQYSVLINGRPRGSMKPSRGICQGEPLSPLYLSLPWII